MFGVSVKMDLFWHRIKQNSNQFMKYLHYFQKLKSLQNQFIYPQQLMSPILVIVLAQKIVENIQ
jgi:hypothetical protein